MDMPWNIKLDPDPNLQNRIRIQVIIIYLMIYWYFNNKKNFKLFFIFFSLIFMLKLDELFRDQDIFMIMINNYNFLI